MSPIAKRLADELLEHHRRVCVPYRQRPPVVDQCVIPYGDLCRRAGVPGIERGVGVYLREVADWCMENGWPPLNSLAVNAESRAPGGKYDSAPGCSLRNWDEEAKQTIIFDGYPATAP